MRKTLYILVFLILSSFQYSNENIDLEKKIMSDIFFEILKQIIPPPPPPSPPNPGYFQRFKAKDGTYYYADVTDRPIPKKSDKRLILIVDSIQEISDNETQIIREKMCFDPYKTGFMNKIDEMNLNMRNDPKLMLGIPNEFLTEVLSEDESRIDSALIKFNSDLMEMTQNSLKPTMIVNQELNKVSLIASNEMLPKISEYKKLINEFTSEFQTILNSISTIDDWDKNASTINGIGENDRAIRMEILWNEIQELMRKELKI